jgi:metal-responsive CopG/Arc/MetJ family transcriptional regulator
MTVRVLSAKLPEELVSAVDAVSAHRGVSRNALVREALKRLVSAVHDAGPTLEERRLTAARATIRRELALRRELPPDRLPTLLGRSGIG